MKLANMIKNGNLDAHIHYTADMESSRWACSKCDSINEEKNIKRCKKCNACKLHGENDCQSFRCRDIQDRKRIDFFLL